MVLFGLHVSCLVGVEAFFFKVEVKTSGPFQIHMHFDRLTFGWTTKWIQKNKYVLQVVPKILVTIYSHDTNASEV